ncbi:MAG TPA: carbamoyltransferase [Verrucomicrobiae bacterium]|nr:carbamoyltransferase [Verrucomicrobiae bacterium]
MNILGISAFYHDSAAALVRDGQIIAAAQEERFSRVKHDARFPLNAVKYCLAEGGVGSGGPDAVAFYEKPLLKFDRILRTHFSVAPRGLRAFVMAMPVWLKQKLWMSLEIERALRHSGVAMPPDLYFPEHHESHAASAFFPSPYPRAAILTLDGVGEWATTTMGVGDGNRVQIIREIRFPHSLGLLYSAFTYFTGFKVNSGEYKLMGLAPFGEPKYVDVIREHLIDIRDDGSFRLNMDYFGYLDELEMTNERFHELFGSPPRKPDAEISQRIMDIARSIQAVTEEVIFKMARHLRKLTDMNRLCMAGGVALNCVANGRLLQERVFDDVWVQPAAGDAGGALGAALIVWHHVKNQPRTADGTHDKMQGSLLGPAFTDEDVRLFVEQHGYPARALAPMEWASTIARLIDEQKVVGLFQGRMEFGPRALGSRSILADPRSGDMQSTLNLRIKFRESFRPFAPACLVERVSEYFDLDRPSPYMLLVAAVKRERLRDTGPTDHTSLHERIHQVRSDIPAVTHVDHSARIQTVDRENNPRFHELLKAFEQRTGCGLVINTSFNVRGEPIVCTLADAYKCFMRTGMDYLVLGSYLLDKREQPSWTEKQNWREDYVLD